MNKLKVMTVVGTRPEVIRLSRVIAMLDRHCDHSLVHTGQNYDYELNQIFFDDLEIRRPDHFLQCAERSDGVAHTIANVISSVDTLLQKHRPDALLVLGDTNSCLSVIPAKRRRIPVFHMEAGNRCFDQRVPEETNRRIIDHVADINLTYSSIARDYLLREGLPPDQVITVGSPMYEVLQHSLSKIHVSDAVSRLSLNKKQYFLVSVHREENVDAQSQLRKVVDILESLGNTFGLPVIVSTHPRTRARIDALGVTLHPTVQLLKPLGFCDYVHLQMNARVVLSDSGTINEEASILNLPALNLREAHERPEGMEEAVAMLVGLSAERVQQGIAILAGDRQGFNGMLQPVKDYHVPNVSEKVLRIIHSYTDYVNRVVWKQY
jgi:UDP-N-acetylglucosamine 2-epimerase (non-hydrolysing)